MPSRPLKVNWARSPERVLTPLSGILARARWESRQCVAQVAHAADVDVAHRVVVSTREDGERREALRLHQRLVVDHDELALVRPAVPLQKTRALWLPTAAAPGRCRGPRCCWTSSAAERGATKCRLRTTLLSRRSSQVVKPAQAGALTTPLPESCRAASSARIASRGCRRPG